MEYRPSDKYTRLKTFRILMLILVLLIGVALKFNFIFQGSLWPDEALYLYIARNLSSDMTNLTDVFGNFFYKSPPMLMYLASLTANIPAIEFDQAVRSIIVLMGVGTILTTYFIGKKLYHPFVGIAAAFLLSVCPLTNWNGVRILTDVPVLFFIYLSICMLVYGNNKAFYAFALCAALTKYTAFALFILPILMALKPKTWAKLYLLGFFLLLAFVSTKGLYSAPDGWLGYFYRFFKFPNVTELVREVKFFLGIFVVVFGSYGLFHTIRERKYSALFHWILLFGICRLFLPWGAFRVSRYSLPLYPGFYLLAAQGCFVSIEMVKAKWPSYSKWAILFVLICLAGVGYHHSVKSRKLLGGTSGTFVGFAEAGAFLAGQPGPRSLATASPRQMKYFAPDFKVYNIAKNVSPDELNDKIRKKEINYISIDFWSLHLPSWCRSYDFQNNGYQLIYGKNNVYIFRVLGDG